ncbi:MAG: DNA polymerase III subunit beta [Candidatus Gracilibacteria bacterium]|jgi:DNA polymerase-3 subunit beta
MKVKCSQRALINALNIANKAVSPNNTLPVLNNILMSAEGKKLSLSATNLEIAIKTTMDAEVFNEGSITIPAKILIGYIGLLKDGDVELKIEDGMSLSIKASHSETKIKGITPEEFPLLPKIEASSTFEISSEDLKDAISQVAFAASFNMVRPVLTGVLFRFVKDGLKMVATDSYRLSERFLKFPSTIKEDIDCIVPAKTVIELGKIISSLKGSIEINISSNQVLFKAGDTILISRLIEGRFPDYEKHMPKEAKTKCEVNSQDLIVAVKKVSLFVVETNNNIKLSITNDGKLILNTEETQVGEGRADVDVKVSGENNKIALNAQYILDALLNIQDDNVLLEVVDKTNPVSIKPLKKKDFVHIIMPLKL